MAQDIPRREEIEAVGVDLYDAAVALKPAVDPEDAAGDPRHAAEGQLVGLHDSG